MLNADLVPIRRKNGELLLTAISGKVRQQHLELAEQLMTVVIGCEGMTREQLQSEMAAVGQSPHESKILKGFAKLIEDAVTFEQERDARAAGLREAVFERAADAWRSLAEGDTFDRAGVLSKVAQVKELAKEQLEQELFIDLPAAQRVVKSVEWTPEQLVDRYDEGRIAAILLRAVQVKATFSVQKVADVRELFRVLKFRRLLFELTELDSGRYELKLTGPYSLFDATTKYGLALALTWPALAIQTALQMEAELRWGKSQERLTFRWPDSARSRASDVKANKLRELGDKGCVDALDVATTECLLDEEIEALKVGLQKAMPSAMVESSDRLLQLPGIGLCIPDLRCTLEGGVEIYVEVMGYWSRDAVWRRVELVEKGLSDKVLFVVSSKLRVSEEVLQETSASALYVYRGRINPASAAAKITELAAHSTAMARPTKGRRRK